MCIYLFIEAELGRRGSLIFSFGRQRLLKRKVNHKAWLMEGIGAGKLWAAAVPPGLQGGWKGGGVELVGCARGVCIEVLVGSPLSQQGAR